MKECNNANSIYGQFHLPLPLSQEEETRLLYSLPNNLEARNILIERNLRLVIYIAKKFENTGVSIEDLVSIGILGLMKSVDSFSISKNVKFSTYASKCIANEILMFLRKDRKVLNNTISLENVICRDKEGNKLTIKDIIPDESASSFTEIYENTMTDRENISFLVTFTLNCLPYNESLIILYKMGSKTQKEIGQELSISQSYISRLEKRACSELKKSLQKTEINFTPNIVFSMIDENFCKIGFSVNIFGNNEIFLSFLSDIKFFYSNDDYIWIKMRLTEETFIGIAELMKKLKLKK